MRTLLIVALLLSVSAAADEAPQATKEQEAAKRRATVKAEGTLRWMTSLKLSTSQRERVLALLIENELRKEKLDDSQGDKIRELLTPTQRETYDTWVKQLRKQRDRQGQRTSQWRNVGLDIETLKEKVGIDDAQGKKVETMLTAMGQRWIQAYQASQQGGTKLDWRELTRQTLAELRKQIDPLLNEDQKAKFATHNGAIDKRLAQWLGKPKDPDKKGSDIQKTLDAAVALLRCDADEEAVFRPMIRGLLETREAAQRDLAQWRKRLTQLASGQADEAALSRAIVSLAKAEAASAARLQAAEESLRELLTRRQEVGLVGLGVLRAKVE